MQNIMNRSQKRLSALLVIMANANAVVSISHNNSVPTQVIGDGRDTMKQLTKTIYDNAAYNGETVSNIVFISSNSTTRHFTVEITKKDGKFVQMKSVDEVMRLYHVGMSIDEVADAIDVEYDKLRFTNEAYIRELYVTLAAKLAYEEDVQYHELDSVTKTMLVEQTRT